MTLLQKTSIGIVSAIISSAFFFFSAKPDGLLHVYFLNVGQGDSTLIQTPSGKNLIIDGGPAQFVMQELSDVLPYFRSTIDYLILTHPDRDHMEGFLYVLARYKVKEILITGSYKNDYFSRTFFKIIKDKKIPVKLVDETKDLNLLDEFRLDILYPFKQRVGLNDADSNEESLVAKAIYGANQILFTGDAPFVEEEELLNAQADLKSTVLKVGHHGSAGSTGENFLSAVAPQFATISVGRENQYNHPSPQVLGKLTRAKAKIFRTDLNGRVEFVFDKEKITMIKSDR